MQILQPVLRLAALLLLPLAADAGSAAGLLMSAPQPAANAEQALSYAADGEIVSAEYLAYEDQLKGFQAETSELNGGSQTALDLPASVADALSPAFRPLAKTLENYRLQAQDKNDPTHLLGKRKRWLQAAMGGTQARINRQLTPCDTPCTDSDVAASNQALLAQRRSSLNTELKAWNALFEDWRKTRMQLIQPLDTAADQVATPVPGSADAQLLATVRANLAREAELLYSISTLAALRADAIDSGMGKNVPDAISGATPKSK